MPPHLCKNISDVRAESQRTVRADAWDMTLDCGNKSTDGVKFVGVRAHDIVLNDTPGLPNSFEFETVSTLRDTSAISSYPQKGFGPPPARCAWR